MVAQTGAHRVFNVRMLGLVMAHCGTPSHMSPHVSRLAPWRLASDEFARPPLCRVVAGALPPLSSRVFGAALHIVTLGAFGDERVHR